jgi:uncharacterized protein (DUF608 family)
LILAFTILVVACPAGAAEKPYQPYVPADKKLEAKWIESLTAKGERKVYTGKELPLLAMPCGGIGAGQIEITGDGTLGSWWIFNEWQRSNRGKGYANGWGYLHPEPVEKRVEHGFAIRVQQPGKAPQVLQLCRKDFDDLRFIGEYPVAILEYRRSGAALPVTIQSEVFSPFVPLSVRDSANPVTVLRFSVTNTTQQAIEVTLAGWLQNAAFPQKGESRANRVRRAPQLTGVVLGADIRFADQLVLGALPRGNGHPQFGDLTIGVLDGQAEASAEWTSFGALVKGLHEGSAPGAEGRTYAANEPGGGSVASHVKLAPGESKQVTFLVSWCFPNLHIKAPGCPGLVGRLYSKWYKDSFEAAQYVAENYERLYRDTRLFHDTYFDTSLPYWLVHRIGMPASTLAAGNIMLWENGRMYAFEGVGFCHGTCGHVYNFVAAIARLFPELERSVRLQQDLAAAFDPESGRINFRGCDGTNPTATWAYASDAQSGYVLKVYREHLMSPDRRFLDSVWPKVKRAIGYHIFRDGAARGLEPNGVLEDLQTFWDPMWYGPNPYNNTLYLAALRAAEEMARIEGEPKLADRYREIFESGRKWMEERMWNGEYYVHLYPAGFGRVDTDNGAVSPADERRNARNYIDALDRGAPHYYVSTGCDANQLFGQNWANRLGLGPILPEEHCRSAMKSVFTYNWTPDIMTVYRLYPPHHRTLCAAGEGALVNGSWPKKPRQPFENIHDKDDIWSGLEYEAACDMIDAGLVQEGLIVVRAIHDRYNGAKRNPWNEIEGAEHYSRAMQSWNVLLAVTGFEYDGPRAHIGFAPRLSPERFRAPFTAAEGWGTFSQKCTPQKRTARIEVKWGQLRVKTIGLAAAKAPGAVAASLDGQPVACRQAWDRGKLMVTLEAETIVPAGESLEITWNDAT